ncbi:MAG: YXWGXW repeat-containing protein [Acetobacteraceae bacterium]|nr:YXWGXW repeat-containing protein [Acetobacteraceae bacterium]
MSTSRLLSASFALLGAAMLLSGCEVVKENTTCPTAPALRAEVRPKPPVMEEEQIWQPGHWDWDGATYTWREGVWIKREGRSNLWMDGIWTRDKVPGPCRWEPAHWVR